jgi:transcription antitermination protein NusB
MKERRLARRLALDVLYEGEIRDRLPVEAWDVRDTDGWVLLSPTDEEVDVGDDYGAPTSEALEYGRSLVEGVQEHHAAIDALIARYADRWAIERMPVIDRNLVRIALFELFWGRDVPVAVAINEAVELAKALSTDDSGRFINGLLGRIVDKELVR